MAVPGFQDFMLPLLTLSADKAEHSIGDCCNQLADVLNVSGDDRKDMLPSGVTRLANRVSWAGTYLRKAGLLEKTVRGRFRITRRGVEALAENPSRIDIAFLNRYPELVEFRARKSAESPSGEALTQPAEEQTPEEALEASYQTLREGLAHELLERIGKCSPAFFEKLVVELLVAMGYGGSRKDAGEAVGRHGDEGVDGIIKEDKLGLDAVYIQAKRWEIAVGRPTVQAFAGSLEGHRARKGVLITTSQFTSDAKDYVTRIEKRIVLIDGDQLAQFMIDHGVGVNEVSSYRVMKIDADYFGDE